LGLQKYQLILRQVRESTKWLCINFSRVLEEIIKQEAMIGIVSEPTEERFQLKRVEWNKKVV
jgi:hypothetical protein